MTSGLHQAYLRVHESHKKIGVRCYERDEGYWPTNNVGSPLNMGDCSPQTGHPKLGWCKRLSEPKMSGLSLSARQAKRQEGVNVRSYGNADKVVIRGDAHDKAIPAAAAADVSGGTASARRHAATPPPGPSVVPRCLRRRLHQPQRQPESVADLRAGTCSHRPIAVIGGHGTMTR
jgi:hypothetical protein